MKRSDLILIGRSASFRVQTLANTLSPEMAHELRAKYISIRLVDNAFMVEEEYGEIYPFHYALAQGKIDSNEMSELIKRYKIKPYELNNIFTQAGKTGFSSLYYICTSKHLDPLPIRNYLWADLFELIHAWGKPAESYVKRPKKLRGFSPFDLLYINENFHEFASELQLILLEISRWNTTTYYRFIPAPHEAESAGNIIQDPFQTIFYYLSHQRTSIEYFDFIFGDIYRHIFAIRRSSFVEEIHEIVQEKFVPIMFEHFIYRIAQMGPIDKEKFAPFMSDAVFNQITGSASFWANKMHKLRQIIIENGSRIKDHRDRMFESVFANIGFIPGCAYLLRDVGEEWWRDCR